MVHASDLDGYNSEGISVSIEGPVVVLRLRSFASRRRINAAEAIVGCGADDEREFHVAEILGNPEA